MGVLARWDERNQAWATASMRDPDRRTGVWVIGVLGVGWAVATGVAIVLGEWPVAVVAGVKAQLFLLVALYVGQGRRRRRGATH